MLRLSQAHPDSSLALNLKACNQFRLYDGKAAEAELAPLVKEAVSHDKIESSLVRHNMVVFQNGERALQVQMRVCSLRRSLRAPAVGASLEAPARRGCLRVAGITRRDATCSMCG